MQRVKLIRALLGVGGLSIASARSVISAFEADTAAEAFAVAQSAMSDSHSEHDAPSELSRSLVTEMARDHGWHFSETNPGIDIAARAVDGLRLVSETHIERTLSTYATAAAHIAEADLQSLLRLASVEEQTELMVTGSVLGDPVLAGLRRIAHESATHSHLSRLVHRRP